MRDVVGLVREVIQKTRLISRLISRLIPRRVQSALKVSSSNVYHAVENN